MRTSVADDRAELEASLDESKSELQSAMGDLRNAARELVTPGEVLARRPYVWIAGVFAAGLLLSRVGKHDR